MEEIDKDGNYCSICGGIPPEKITTRRVMIDDRETGIDQLEFVFEEVKRLGLTDDSILAGEILKRVKVFNYVPSKKEALYKEALLREYKQEVQS
ncbi:MAG: NAC family transcription factor [Methanoregulaceae archaeon]|nr:NAC family transcription factor [Methanoregulaceae archaeon]